MSQYLHCIVAKGPGTDPSDTTLWREDKLRDPPAGVLLDQWFRFIKIHHPMKSNNVQTDRRGVIKRNSIIVYNCGYLTKSKFTETIFSGTPTMTIETRDTTHLADGCYSRLIDQLPPLSTQPYDPQKNVLTKTPGKGKK